MSACCRRIIINDRNASGDVTNGSSPPGLALPQAPAAHCPVHRVDLDFKDEERTLATELGSEGSAFDAAAPALFIAEGLIMYLGALGKIKLLKDVSAVAAPLCLHHVM